MVDFPGGSVVKKSICQCIRHRKLRFDPWVRKEDPRRRKWQLTPVFLPAGGPQSMELQRVEYDLVTKEQQHAM